MTTRDPTDEYTLRVIGHVRSELKARKGAPRQGNEGAPDAWIELDPACAPALLRLAADDDVLLFTWLHQGNRETLQVHPRGDPSNPLTGVFLTRSPDRPNPIGLHRVTVREVRGTRLRVGPLEAIDGTPVIDLKAVLEDRER
jgi:tRNA-Thr(GGU) m(6)t(6)A37 methyltransferase TsaA